MQKPEIAIASLVVNKKKVIVKGTTAPPPPMPPMFERASTTVKTMMPRNSMPRIGKMPLCSQWWLCGLHSKWG